MTIRKGTFVLSILVAGTVGFVLGRELMRQAKDEEYEADRRRLANHEIQVERLRDKVAETKDEAKEVKRELKDLKEYHKIIKTEYSSVKPSKDGSAEIKMAAVVSDEEAIATSDPSENPEIVASFVNKEVDDDGTVTYKAHHIDEDGNVVGVSISDSLFEKNIDEPYLIHRPDFEDGEDRYQRDFFTYYAKDATLLDDNDNPWTDKDLCRPTKTFDPQLLETFGYLEEEPDVILIRNETLMIDYEITRVDMSYNEHVLGLGYVEGDSA